MLMINDLETRCETEMVKLMIHILQWRMHAWMIIL